MRDKFTALMDGLSEAVENAAPDTKEHIYYISTVWEETAKAAAATEIRLVGQIVDDYDPRGNSPLNTVVNESRDKLESMMKLNLAACVDDPEEGGFPNNFIERIRYLASEDNEDVLTDEMIEEIRAYSQQPPLTNDFRIPKGISVLDEQLSSLTLRDFSRRLQQGYDRAPTLSLVPAS